MWHRTILVDFLDKFKRPQPRYNPSPRHILSKQPKPKTQLSPKNNYTHIERNRERERERTENLRENHGTHHKTNLKHHHKYRVFISIQNRKLKRCQRLKRCNRKLNRRRHLKHCNRKLNHRDEGLMGLMG